jgi:hypothetical protein
MEGDAPDEGDAPSWAAQQEQHEQEPETFNVDVAAEAAEEPVIVERPSDGNRFILVDAGACGVASRRTRARYA